MTNTEYENMEKRGGGVSVIGIGSRNNSRLEKLLWLGMFGGAFVGIVGALTDNKYEIAIGSVAYITASVKLRKYLRKK